MFWISQFLVLLAYFLLGIGLRKNSKITILYYSIIYQFLMMLQYLLLNGFVGVISSAIGIVRNIVFINNECKHRKNSKGILLVFTGLTIILTSIFFTGFVDVFPCILTILGIYSYWLGDMKVIRIGNIGISICYIIYAISLNSWVSVLCEGYIIINVILGCLREKNEKNYQKSYVSREE